jgi:subtilisin family serine protease
MNTTPKPWFKHTLRILSFILIAILTVASLMNGTAAGGSDSQVDGEQYQTVELPPGAASLSPDTLTTAPAPSHPKLDTTMAKLAAEAKISPSEALNSAGSNLVRVSEDRVQVQIITSPEVWDSAVEVVIQAGGEVTGVAFNDTVIQGWLPVTSLEGVASNDVVYYVQRPVTLVLDEIQATTEGLAVMNGNDWHTAGYNGTGAKIGIIDAGFQGYPSLLGSDLPPSLTVKNFVDGETDAQVDGTTKHGTACAEIVYDIAPGATMYLAKVASDVDLEEAVNWLKNTHHVDVISTSLSYFNTSPGDGTGYLANLAQNARNAGILWAKSAGNYREYHWGGAFYDPDGDGYHNFDGDQEINYFGPGDGNAYNISSGNYLRVFLRWDDWSSVNQDYNLHLVRYNGSDWDLVVSSTDTQNGGGGQQPTEAVIGLTSGSSTPYGFLIERISSTRNVHFEVLAPSTAHLDEYVFARSMGDPADAPAIVAVAALDVVSPYPHESYSSEGPTNGPGGTESGGFTKPDISGFANVSTASYGAGGFGGTSSATPHVAGAAALVFGAYPGYTPDQVQSFLEGRAIDMGPAGMDTRYGHGRLYLGDAPGPPADKVWNGDVSNNWHTAGNWTPSGVPTSSDTQC